jgi:hypothetical protein
MNWTIINTYHNQPIHIDHLKFSNPSAQIIPLKINEKEHYSVAAAWRNSDFLTRNQLRKIIDSIEYEDVLIIAWDVLINTKINYISYHDVFGFPTKYYVDDSTWCWFHEIYKLPNFLQFKARGLTIPCVYGIKKYVIKDLLNPIWDDIFMQDIFCELRLGTIISYMNYNISEWPQELQYTQSNIGWKNNPNLVDFISKGNKGIFHPVKINI